ncbi:MAG: hypothetical protein DIZ80_15825 [endosymbiont of Galathealinum brachiosum]|uniref:3-hydroxyacyl-CoA dehydrogenase NAD binding domain-containing protein n=1 Tax=endosymbiont of Galathealinum brachiosum TaxID=2200906 RepID=A0A370DAZ2_9GAMM|nr:MAG: hypothetical protein DIZ80_15825 [endosymbiont of Galathealinum brachiosum]
MMINVLGFGLMGKQISALLYLSGCEVNIYSRNDINEKDFLRQVKILKKSLRDTREGKYVLYAELNELPNCTTIESVVEDITIKKEIYEKIRLNNNSLYLTNTSSYSPDEISSEILGMHFFNPISLGLIELSNNNVKQEELGDLSSLVSKFESLGYVVVDVNENRGYIGNYILFHEISSALKLVEKFGYGVEQINQVYSKLYDGRDIFFIIDLIGIDVSYKILSNLKEVDETIYMPKTLKKALERNILGRKNKTTIKSIIEDV